MTDHDASAAICDAVTQLASGEPARFRDLLAADVRWIVRGSSAWSSSHHGRDHVLRFLRRVAGLLDGGWRARVERMLSTGVHADAGVVVVELRGDNRLHDGRRYDNAYCWLVSFDRGEIREIIEYGDTALIDRVLPPPATST